MAETNNIDMTFESDVISTTTVMSSGEAVEA
jgi:hypothetical protein